MNQKIIAFRAKWEKGEIGRQLKKGYKNSPDKDSNAREKYENVKLRMRDLSKVLYLLYNIYDKNKELYGEKFYAFVGNEVVRNWPHLDLPFESVNYSNETVGIYEHFTPISFFRDLLDEPNMTEQDFYDALLYFHRVVKISKNENKTLDSSKYKSRRPFNAYEQLGIKIKETEHWNSIYGELDAQIKKNN